MRIETSSQPPTDEERAAAAAKGQSIAVLNVAMILQHLEPKLRALRDLVTSVDPEADKEAAGTAAMLELMATRVLATHLHMSTTSVMHKLKISQETMADIVATVLRAMQAPDEEQLDGAEPQPEPAPPDQPPSAGAPAVSVHVSTSTVVERLRKKLQLLETSSEEVLAGLSGDEYQQAALEELVATRALGTQVTLNTNQLMTEHKISEAKTARLVSAALTKFNQQPDESADEVRQFFDTLLDVAAEEDAP